MADGCDTTQATPASVGSAAVSPAHEREVEGEAVGAPHDTAVVCGTLEKRGENFVRV
jgi:hypothetical protein